MAWDYANRKMPFGLLEQGDPTSDNHVGLTYPLTVCLIHYAVIWVISVWSHDALHETLDCHYNKRTKLIISCFFIGYATWLLLWRLFSRKSPSARHSQSSPRGLAIYEYCWLCNVTLWMSAYALLTDRPVLASAYCIVVGIDQLLWYVDLGVFVIAGKFPIGVAKYLTWPENDNWSSRLTWTHHLWTIPMILYAVRSKIKLSAYPLAFVIMSANVVLSRFLTPPEVRTKQGTFYLNVNLSHSVWKDITFQCLQINDTNAFQYMFQLLWRWQGFNTVIFIILYSFCHCVFETNGRPCWLTPN
jgi:hypothetical protein